MDAGQEKLLKCRLRTGSKKTQGTTMSPLAQMISQVTGTT